MDITFSLVSPPAKDSVLTGLGNHVISSIFLNISLQGKDFKIIYIIYMCMTLLVHGDKTIFIIILSHNLPYSQCGCLHGEWVKLLQPQCK